MGAVRTPLIAGNWKMNLDHLQAVAFVQKLHWTLKDAKHEDGSVEVAVFPPFTDLRTVQTLLDADKIPFALGAQDLSPKDSGAYTGDISGAFLAKLDARYVIIGHSERREYHHETDEVVASKVQAALRHGLVPVICVGADQITVSNKTIPEVDITYFLSPNLAAELILTYPQKHKVYLSGTNIGTFKHLPPTLSLQYHFTPAAQISPYVGAGVNYTRLSSVKLLGGAGDLESHSFGLALQAGVDFKIDKNWSINLDVKKVQIRSDVMVGGAKVSEVKVDPLLIGVGVGYRF